MKNSTVECMVRKQFNLADDIDVVVECLASVSTPNENPSHMYEFKVIWVNDDKHHTINVELPLLSPTITEIAPQIGPDVGELWTMGKFPVVTINCKQKTTHSRVLHLLSGGMFSQKGTVDAVAPYMYKVTRNDTGMVDFISMELHSNDEDELNEFLKLLNSVLAA